MSLRPAEQDGIIMPNARFRSSADGLPADVGTVLQTFWDACHDGGGAPGTDKFRILAGGLFMHVVQDKVADGEMLSRFNRKVSALLGNGHSGASCLQFWSGRKGRLALRAVARDFPDLIPEGALERLTTPPAWESQKGGKSLDEMKAIFGGSGAQA